MFKIRNRRIISGVLGMVLSVLFFFSVPVNVHATDVALGGDEVAIELLLQLAAAAFGTEVASDVMDYITLTPEMLNTGSYKYGDGTVIKNAGRYAASEVFVSSDTSLSDIQDLVDDTFSSSLSSPSYDSFKMISNLNVPVYFLSNNTIDENITGYSSYAIATDNNDPLHRLIYFNVSGDNYDKSYWGLHITLFNNGNICFDNAISYNGSDVVFNPGTIVRYDEYYNRSIHKNTNHHYLSNASIYVSGNVMLVNETPEGHKFNVFFYSNGNLIKSIYIPRDFGNFSTSDFGSALFNPSSCSVASSTNFNDFFSTISSSISKVGDFVKTDPQAINTAYQNYNTSSKTEDDYAAYIAALNAALAASAASQAEVSEDVKGIAGAMSTVLSWLQKIWSILSLIPTSLASIISIISAIKDHIIAQDFATWIEDIKQNIISLPQTIADAFGFDTFVSDLSAFWEDILDPVGTIKEKLIALPQTIADTLGFDTFVSDLSAFWEDILDPVRTIRDKITTLPQDIADAFDDFITDIKANWADILETVDTIKEKIIALPEAIADAFDDFVSDASAFWNKICGFAKDIYDEIVSWSFVQWVQDLVDAITSIPDTIDQYLEDLFVIDEAAQERISDKVEATFAPVLWIKDFVDTVKVAFIRIFKPQPNPPKIPIHLENATSKYNYGDTVYIDFAFWQPYKQIADPIIVAFCWAMFLWHAFKTIPGLISGSDGLIGNDSDNWSDKYDAFMWSHDFRAWEAHHSK